MSAESEDLELKQLSRALLNFMHYSHINTPLPTWGLYMKQDLSVMASGPRKTFFESMKPIPRVEFSKHLPTVGICYYNYEAFMNRHIDEASYVIEAFLTKSSLENDSTARASRRDVSTNGRDRPWISTNVEEFGDDRRLQRVRIRSEIVLSYLSGLMGLADAPSHSLVFFRPFGVFWHYHNGMKRILADLETTVKSKTVLEGHVGTDGSPIGGSFASGEETKAAKAPSLSLKTALEHIRIYIRFVEEEVLPLYLQYREPKPGHLKIRYEDIPFLFRPGGLVFYQPLARHGNILHHTAAQQVWRMVECVPMVHPQISFIAGTSWRIYCLDFYGEITPIWIDVKFDYFTGERDVSELICFPLQFHAHYKSILEDQKAVGLKFKKATSNIQHLYYSGWTFVTGILAESLEDDKGSRIDHPEYIESEVVIDCKEAIRTFPKWQTSSSLLSKHPHYMCVRPEPGYLVYGDESEAQPIRYDDAVLTCEEKMYDILAVQYSSEDVFIQKIADSTRYEWKDDDLALLPRRVFGYVLRERRFTRLDVTCIGRDNEQNKVTLDDIEMNENNRMIIRSAVTSHFRAQQQEKMLNIATFNLDAIRGKGKGLTILLHGAPGAGKTATVEAVAIENSKPLLPITCGDLGTKPEVVEKTLRDIFRYAHHWECILLLDEADVFLTQRERNSLDRNALVGVFLRVLEYYRGVLFLTTNRVGALDEAFRSRVHVSLWYPHLTVEQTIKILDNSLDRLPQPSAAEGKPVYGLIKVMYREIEEFVREEYMKYSRAIGRKRGPWNGRQIRNAVQIATCLALYQKETEDAKDDFPAVLTASHFQSVAETTSEFEDFLKNTRVGDDAFWAQQRNDRADDWNRAGDHGDDGYQNFWQQAPLAQRGSLQPGGTFTPQRTAMSQSSVKSPHYATSQLYDRGDNTSETYDYNNVNGSRSSRRPLNSGGSPRLKAASLEYSGQSGRRCLPDDLKTLDGSHGPRLDEGYPEESAPDENNRAWESAWDNEKWTASLRRDNRGGGYRGA
ncbi:hypothetical protein F5Y10DRAFT_286223 [Nemania abortiva]|nr:hypothetical protein F5Y10DRAFT_286223 [Nemania abortiva]